MKGLENATKTQREVRSMALSIYIVEEERGGWSAPRPGRFVPRQETRYPLHRGLDGSRGLSDQNHIHKYGNVCDVMIY